MFVCVSRHSHHCDRKSIFRDPATLKSQHTIATYMSQPQNSSVASTSSSNPSFDRTLVEELLTQFAEETSTDPHTSIVPLYGEFLDRVRAESLSQSFATTFRQYKHNLISKVELFKNIIGYFAANDCRGFILDIAQFMPREWDIKCPTGNEYPRQRDVVVRMSRLAEWESWGTFPEQLQS